MTLPLDGIRVLDISEGIAGPYCTKLFACQGADVIKVERRGGGDTMRRLGPFVGDDPHPEKSIPFLYLNTGKRSVTLDLATDEGVDTLMRLAEQSDVLVESFDASLREARGLTYEAFERVNSRIVVASISHFGLTGPWSDYRGAEIVDQAVSGHMYITGEPAQEPLQIGGSFAEHSCGQAAFAGAMMALFSALSTGRGQLVDVSIAESLMDLLDGPAIHALAGARERLRQGNVTEGSLRYRGGLYPCKDGWATLGQAPSGWDAFAAMIAGDSPPDPRFGDNTKRREFHAELEAMVEAWTLQRGKLEIYEASQRTRNAAGYVALPEDLLASQHLAARGFFQRVEHDVAGPALYPGGPFRLAGEGWQQKPAPMLGEHNAAVYGSLLGMTDAEVAGLRQDDVIQKGPPDLSRDLLEGLRVLDLTQIRAGPKAARWLADAGAEVIKIEHLKRPDFRPEGGRLPIPESEQRRYNRWGGIGFDQLHRNKLALSLDLSVEEGKNIFRRLVAISDVVLDNFSAGVMDRLGLGYENLSKVRPELVMLSMPAFGVTGPDRDFVGYGWTLEHLGGISARTGYEGGQPLRSGTMTPDPLNGVHGAAAIMTALVRRARTGKGCFIELSQWESLIALAGDWLLEHQFNNRTTGPMGNRDRVFAPQGCYRCRGDDGWVVLSVRTSAEWHALCGVLERPALLADSRLSTSAGRRAHQSEVDGVISSWTRERSKFEAMDALQQAGVPAGAVLTNAEALSTAQVSSRGFVQHVRHPDGDVWPYMTGPWHFSKQPVSVRTPAPLLGEHNAYVLGDLLGYTGQEIDDMDARGLTSTFFSTPGSGSGRSTE